MLRKCLLFLLLSSFIIPLFVISYTFAHEVTIPKTLSGLAVFWLFMPLFSVVIVSVISVLSVINLMTFWDIAKADKNLEKGFRTRDIAYFYRAMENPLIRNKAMPFYSQLLFWEGESKGDRRLMEEGLRVMKDHYAFQPTAQVAHIIGQYYLSLGNKEEAVKWWQQGLRFQPKYEPIRLSLQGLSTPRDEKVKDIFDALRRRLRERGAKAQPLLDNKKNH